MSEILLRGCAPVPLAFYLKALGILRIVGRQIDSGAKGFWRKEGFLLCTKLDDSSLLDFFLNEYRPTPILVPWSGNDFFTVSRSVRPDDFRAAFSNRPSASVVIEAVIATSSVRLELYRASLNATLRVMDTIGVLKKKDIEGSGATAKRKKAGLLQSLRNILQDEVVPWIDAAAIIDEDGFSPNNLLGSGGGSDGNSNFSDNFMQSLWAVLTDFDYQRKKPLGAVGGANFDSRAALTESLFGTRSRSTQLQKLSPVLFDSTRVGGPNSDNGFESGAASNPWDFILMIEGACLFAGALAKKLGTSNPSSARFPYLLAASPVGAGSLGSGESGGRELWLPLWGAPSSLNELTESFASGRMESQSRVAAYGTDAVQAIAQYGVDRGIEKFQRFGLFRGRIGGDNYFTSADLGLFRVSRNPSVDLLADIDGWLPSFRAKASSDKAPFSVTRALRRLESAILALCEQGGALAVQDVLIALGHCEQVLARSLKWTIKSFIRPVSLLSSQWIKDANDGSPEYRLAASLASLSGRYGKTVVPFRYQLAPVFQGRFRVKWAEQATVDVGWHEGDIIQAVNSVMARRLLLASKAGAHSWPDTARFYANLGDVAAFVEGRINLTRFAELLWGFCPVDWPQVAVARSSEQEYNLPSATLALMKLCFAGTSVRDVEIPLTLAIHQRAAMGNGTTATQLAAHRLRASGLPPAIEQVHEQGESVRRAAAALLFPISETDLNALANAVLRPRTTIT